MNNPLLMPFVLPPFSKIESEHIVPACTKILKDCRIAIEEIISQSEPYTWNNFCQKIIEINDLLEKIFSLVSHLNSVRNSMELRKAYEKILPLLSEYNAWIGQNEKLYMAYKNVSKNRDYILLNAEKRKSVDNTLLNFKLSGINLKKEKKKRYSEITVLLSQLSNQFSNNVLDATMGWSKFIDDKVRLTGIPDNILEIAQIRAKEKGKRGYLLTLDIPSYLPVITYCDDRILREEIYRAYNTRASDQGPHAGKWDNSKIIEEILALRHELAQLLGFQNYMQKSLTNKMVKNSNQILNFLMNLARLVRPKGELELTQLRTFSEKIFNIKELYPWDIAYYSEKQKQYIYNINEEQLRLYFPENKVINGLFEIIKRIYGFNIKERYDVDVWHPDVRFFELYDEQNSMFGSFYLDLYTRENKRAGAWMDDCVSRMRKLDGSLQKPVAYLVCNFNRPIKEKPALFTHKEVITLFHEFGHGLHHILTCVEVADISGIRGVPWDAIELPSQLMENWCWEPEVLSLISGHYETGEPLPKCLINRIQKLKNYQVAMFILRQIEFSLFDFLLHTEFTQEKGARIIEILSEVNKQIAVIANPSWGRFSHTFNHIFANGYAAGYYSYLWADMLASDVYSLFKEGGIFNRKIGQSFLNNILIRGGSEDPMELFKRFLGRAPKMESMLINYGIKN